MAIINIRFATKDDIDFIVDSQLKMAFETEALRLDKDIVKQGVSAIFDDYNKGEYIIAETKSGLSIGCLMLTSEWSDWRNSWVKWIQSVYVVTEFRNNGVFRNLYTFVNQNIENCKNISGLRLYVDKRNVTACEVYKAIGMNNEHYSLFELMK